MQEQEDQPHRAVTAGVPVSSAKPDGSAGIRCFVYWTVGETTEAELREVFASLADKAVEVFKRRNGQVLN